MAYYRQITSSFWTDSKVVDYFTPEDKFFYLYLLTNPLVNIIGCYEIGFRQMSYDTGYNTDTCKRLLNRLETVHNVIRYDKDTGEILIINFYKYNWNKSPKVRTAVEAVAKYVKSQAFKDYILGLLDGNEVTLSIGYGYPMDTSVSVSVTDSVSVSVSDNKKKKSEKHKYGEHGWIKLSDEEHQRLIDDLGEDEVQRVVAYVDEYVQSNGNRNGYKDWNAVLRKASRERWGWKKGMPTPSAPVPVQTNEELQALIERI